MEADTYVLLKHKTYMTYEYTLRDPDCWDDSIKMKYNEQRQQKKTIKEEEDPSSSGYQQQQNNLK